MNGLTTLDRLRRGELAGVTRLDLSADLTALPREVFDLADTLEVLNLSGNRLTDLPHDMGRLKKLKIVFGSNNLFEHLPESLGECPALEVVGFKATRIRHVSAEALPPALRWLILTDNAIAQLPDALGERPALQKLMLAGNRLTQLPEGLGNAQKLELLRISANRFEHLPGWLTRLPRLAWLALAGNPLGWQMPALSRLPRLPWASLQVRERLGEGASGHIFRATTELGDLACNLVGEWALKLFKGEVTSDGLPEHEIAGSLAAGPHPALCTPVAELYDHPQATRGMVLPLLPATHRVLAGPPSMHSCTRDVYAPGFSLPLPSAMAMARQITAGLAHLHARGVMHGDFYAHNILWDPHTAQAVLSDMGGSTVLPADQPALRHALLSLEVRALGYWLEELVAHVPAAALDSADGRALQAAVHDALALDPAERPTVSDVAQRLGA